jgi:small-conductance mechanosensitive channel
MVRPVVIGGRAMTELWQWINENGVVLGWLGVTSFVMFVGSLVIIPVLAARIPADYFVDRERHLSRSRRIHPIAYLIFMVGKNGVGILLIIVGIVMLVLPGQGILTILIGVSLTDFPGKYILERSLVAQPSVYNAINWIRKRANKKPLKKPIVD